MNQCDRLFLYRFRCRNPSIVRVHPSPSVIETLVKAKSGNWSCCVDCLCEVYNSRAKKKKKNRYIGSNVTSRCR